MKDFSKKRYLRNQEPARKSLFREVTSEIAAVATGLAMIGGLVALTYYSQNDAELRKMRQIPVAKHVMKDFRKHGTSETVHGMCAAEGLEENLRACETIVRELNPKLEHRGPRAGEVIYGPDANGDGEFGRTDYD